MKRMLLILAIVGLVVISGCTSTSEYKETGTLDEESCHLKILSHSLKTDGYNYYVVRNSH